MIWQFYKFKNDEDGAVTVDWVILSAAVVGLASLGFLGVEDSSSSVADKTEEGIESYTAIVETW